MTREILGQTERILRNVTIEQLMGELEQTFKMIEGKGKATDRYEIDPEEINHLAGITEESMELVGQLQ